MPNSNFREAGGLWLLLWVLAVQWVAFGRAQWVERVVHCSAVNQRACGATELLSSSCRPGKTRPTHESLSETTAVSYLPSLPAARPRPPPQWGMRSTLETSTQSPRFVSKELITPC